MSNPTASTRDGRTVDGRDRPCDEQACLGGLSRAEAFSLLGNDDRLSILDAVVRAEFHEDEPYPVAFSTLRRSVDVRDSGRFSYHLRRLTGHFLERTPDGYALHGTVCPPVYEALAVPLDGGDT